MNYNLKDEITLNGNILSKGSVNIDLTNTGLDIDGDRIYAFGKMLFININEGVVSEIIKQKKPSQYIIDEFKKNKLGD